MAKEMALIDSLKAPTTRTQKEYKMEIVMDLRMASHLMNEMELMLREYHSEIG